MSSEPSPTEAAPPADAQPVDQVVVEAPKKSVATLLVELARQWFELGVTPEDEPFAVPGFGPPLVRMVRGGRGSLRSELARGYFQRCASVPSQGALADALQVITGMANECEPTPLALRVACSGDALVLDLGDATGQAVVIRPEDWKVEQPPVLFRRTELTAALPTPQRGGVLDELWTLINVAEDDRPVLAAVLASALMATVPHVITALVGEQGSGKTSATKMLAALLDPSPAQVRRAPRDVETWTTAAAGSWVVALDNLSGITDQISDALCRASTGDGDVRRRLYSDGDLHVIAFMRVVFVNGIDLGAVNDDLADRLVTVTLKRLVDYQRRRDADMTEAWRAAHPRVLGALLDLTCAVLRELPTIELDSPPRMADFGYVLTAVDTVLGTRGMGTYLRSRTTLAEEAMTSDPVLTAIADTITTDFLGTSAELLSLITPLDDQGRPPKDWPTARELTTILRRRAPSLRRLGWTVEEAAKDPRARAVRFQLIPPPQDRRRGANVARNARTLTPGGIIAGQQGWWGASEGASEDPGCERGASDDARSSGDARTLARTGTVCLSSTNGALASVASDTSAIYASPPLTECATPQPDEVEP
jgi:energy-coupling factor transporter ATP-binding protein EcfA2